MELLKNSLWSGIFENAAFMCTSNYPVHANNSEYICVKHGKLGYCLKVIIFKSIPCVHVDGENNAFDVNLDLF